MTFNTIKIQQQEKISATNLVMQSNTEITEQTYSIIANNGYLSSVTDVVSEILNGRQSNLESLFSNIEQTGDTASLMHVSNVITFLLFEKYKKDCLIELSKKDFENFNIEKLTQNEDYDDDDGYYEKIMNQRKKEVIEKLKSKKQADFLYEIEEARNQLTPLKNNIDIKAITNLLKKTWINLTKKNTKVLLGDKNAMLQAALNLQKCAILNNSAEDFNYVKDELKIISPMLMNNIMLQNQVFSNKGVNLIEEYIYLLPKGSEEELLSREYYKNRKNNEVLSIIENQDNSGKSKNKSNLINTLKYNTFAKDFMSLFLINNYLSLNEGIEVNFNNRNKLINFDIQNIKNFISESSNNHNKLSFFSMEEQNSSCLFLISNSAIKNMIKEAKEVGSKNFDLAFIKNCSKLIAESNSLELYDFVLNDDILSNIINKQKLLQLIVENALTYSLYDYGQKRENSDEDIPTLFLQQLIQLFHEHLSYEQMEESFKIAIENNEKRRTPDPKNKNKNESNLINAMNELSEEEQYTHQLIIDMLNGEIREGKFKKKFKEIGKPEIIINKRRKI